jgi:hypothetical protein
MSLTIEIKPFKFIPAMIDTICVTTFAYYALFAKPRIILPIIGVFTLNNCWQIYTKLDKICKKE